MNKTEFMSVLTKNINYLSEEEKKDILYDYEEHFSIGLEKGKTEEEIAKSLGDPISLAQKYNINKLINNAEKEKSTENIMRVVFATLGLGFLNFIFVFGPFCTIAGILIFLFLISFAVALGGIGFLIWSLISPFISSSVTIGLHPVACIFFSIGIFCTGLLMGIGSFYLSKLFYILTIKYVKFNLKIITGKEE